MKLKEIGASVFETTSAGSIASIASSLFTPTASGQPAVIRRTKKKKDNDPSIYEGSAKPEYHNTQVKGKDPIPSKSKPTSGHETPHPFRGKLVGEGDMEADREAGIKWVDNPDWKRLHEMDLKMVKDFLDHKESVPEKEEFKHPDAGVPLSVRRARKKKSKKQQKIDMHHADHLSKSHHEFTGSASDRLQNLGDAVGDSAEPLYDLQDELGLEDNILVDELARYLDVDQIADFVAHFRRHHELGEGDGRKRGIHPKGHPKRRAQQAAIHAEGKK